MDEKKMEESDLNRRNDMYRKKKIICKYRKHTDQHNNYYFGNVHWRRSEEGKK